MAEVFSTTGLKRHDGEASWRSAMSENFVSVDIANVPDGTFNGSIEANWVGSVMLGRVRSTAQEIVRTQRLVNHAAAELFQVGIVNSGLAHVEQDGRQTILYPGDVAVYETNRPFDWSFDRDWDVSVFTFPMEAIALGADERRHLTARRLDGRNPLTGLASRFLLDLARTSATVPSEQAERLVTHAGDLLVTLLGGGLDDDETVQSALQRTLLTRAKDYIAKNLANPGLGPQDIAAAVSISPRYLHRIFESEDRSVTHYVRELRLERCWRDLTDPAHAARPISDIAFGHGFGDLSGFNRVFKARYGVRPSELRLAPQPLQARQVPAPRQLPSPPLHIRHGGQVT